MIVAGCLIVNRLACVGYMLASSCGAIRYAIAPYILRLTVLMSCRAFILLNRIVCLLILGILF